MAIVTPHAATASSSAPAGVLLAVMSTEYQTSSDLALAIVFMSTILSPLTVTMVIFLTRA
jgi:predicted permease